MVGVVDRCGIPAPFAKTVQGDMARRTRAAVNRIGRPGALAQQPSPTADYESASGDVQSRRSPAVPQAVLQDVGADNAPADCSMPLQNPARIRTR